MVLTSSVATTSTFLFASRAAERSARLPNAKFSRETARILDEHFQGVEIHDKLIWSLLTFQVWYEQYIDGCGGRNL